MNNAQYGEGQPWPLKIFIGVAFAFLFLTMLVATWKWKGTENAALSTRGTTVNFTGLQTSELPRFSLFKKPKRPAFLQKKLRNFFKDIP